MTRKRGQRGKDGQCVGDKLLEHESVKHWIESLKKQAVAKGKLFSNNAKIHKLARMMEYTNDGETNPDTLLADAKKNIDAAGDKLQAYFEAKLKAKIEWNSAVTALCDVRGFYTHNDVVFPKRLKVPKRHVSTVKKTDGKTTIYDYNEEADETVFRNGLIQHFFDNLSFRDQTLGLCSFSTGADFADLLALKRGFVNDAKGELSLAKRFLFHGNRLKDGVEFKVFFSAESSEYIRRYVQQERMNAASDEPLFAKSTGEALTVHALTINFRTAAENMGLQITDETNPFRPKRFRSLFRTACGLANIDVGFIMAMMGHASSVSASYLEKPDGMFLKEYLKVEPWITVYGVDKSQIAAIGENFDDLRKELSRISEENAELKKYFGEFSKLGFTPEDFAELKKWMMHKADVTRLLELAGRGELVHINDPELPKKLRDKGVIS